MDWKNTLFFGDNLDIPRQRVAENVVLIFLDPPFKSNSSYSELSKEKRGKDFAAPFTAFEDKLHRSVQSGTLCTRASYYR
jgi:hypothetical protein